jgi:hypothetical protein
LQGFLMPRAPTVPLCHSLRCLCTFFNCGIVHRVTIG